jgi:uncharacterized protein DUF4157
MQAFAQADRSKHAVHPLRVRLDKPTSGLHHTGSVPNLRPTVEIRKQETLNRNIERSEVEWTGTRPTRSAHDFSRIPLLSRAAAAIQMKLAISRPGDEYEQEADRVADRVMRAPEPQRASNCGGECPECRSKHPVQEMERLQAKHIGASGSKGGSIPPVVNEALRSPSQSLGAETRAFMEPRFGHDFSQVQVHADTKAADSARALDALAYTVGPHVVFGAKQFVPHTTEGRRLLAHELTHVVQQRSQKNSDRKVVMRQPRPRVEAKFAGCTGAQENQIEAAAQDARAAINAAAAVIGNAYGRPDRLTQAHRQLLLDHFHTTSHDDLRAILGNYTSIKRAFEAGLKFRCETTCKKDVSQAVCVGGYAVATKLFGGFGPIHVCFDQSPGGCDFASSAAHDNTALLIHEAAHRYAGIKGDVYRWDSDYATLSSDAAIDNADSYAWFAVLV